MHSLQRGGKKNHLKHAFKIQPGKPKLIHSLIMSSNGAMNNRVSLMWTKPREVTPRTLGGTGPSNRARVHADNPTHRLRTSSPHPLRQKHNENDVPARPPPFQRVTPLPAAGSWGALRPPQNSPLWLLPELPLPPNKD